MKVAFSILLAEATAIVVCLTMRPENATGKSLFFGTAFICALVLLLWVARESDKP